MARAHGGAGAAPLRELRLLTRAPRRIPLASLGRLAQILVENHLTSAFIASKHELGAMLASGGGNIVNVGTFVGTTKTFPGTAAYAAAKSGLVGLTRTIAAEYARDDIRANLLVVGGVELPAHTSPSIQR